LIHAFKYKNAAFLGDVFAELMIRDLGATEIMREVNLVMAVPLHWQRQAKRGYNQAELLVERIAQRQKLPTASGNLVRVKNTPTQTARTRAERMENLLGAFAVQRPHQVDGKKILLCDDVMTTGATASECAHVLREAGAKAVYVSVLAR
jgi:ComF family protein